MKIGANFQDNKKNQALYYLTSWGWKFESKNIDYNHPFIFVQNLISYYYQYNISYLGSDPMEEAACYIDFIENTPQIWSQYERFMIDEKDYPINTSNV